VTVESATLHLADASLYFERRGSGPPLVVVHGSWDDHRTWDGVVGELSGSFTTVAYDRRGHGRSSAPPGQGRIGEDVADLAAVIDGLGLAPANLVARPSCSSTCATGTISCAGR
jgi:pimeloyl-ACP methyl ester carboxylesterase